MLATTNSEVEIELDEVKVPVERQESVTECVICMESPATSVIEGCGHKIICDNSNCLKGVTKHGKCPICRRVGRSESGREKFVVTSSTGKKYTAGATQFSEYVLPIPASVFSSSSRSSSTNQLKGCCFVTLILLGYLSLTLIAPPVLVHSYLASQGIESSLGDAIANLLGLCGIGLGAFLATVSLAALLLNVLNEGCLGYLVYVFVIVAVLYLIPLALCTYAGQETFVALLILAQIIGALIRDTLQLCFTYQKERDSESEQDTRTAGQHLWNYIISRPIGALAGFAIGSWLSNGYILVADSENMSSSVATVGAIWGAFAPPAFLVFLPFFFPGHFIAVVH